MTSDTDKPGPAHPPVGGSQPPAGPDAPPRPPDAQAKWKSRAKIAFAIALYVGSLPLPFPFGTVAHVIAISILVKESKTAQTWVAKARRRWPKYADTFFRVGTKVLPKMIGEIDTLTNPDKVLGPKPPPAPIRSDDAPPPPAPARFHAFPARPRTESIRRPRSLPAPANDTHPPAAKPLPRRLPRP